ncbi:hypothetical protein NQ315_000979 [Exocentrus adspersus]|uniref:Macro domain-containing protein n=1 Tax=Exocentrus adspersus TaxID=1586481 RepID=A0AAV8WFA0_9CUCU|nr:hypothetical protein NQ315_000979 [Exocentrus adspersus]
MVKNKKKFVKYVPDQVPASSKKNNSEKSSKTPPGTLSNSYVEADARRNTNLRAEADSADIKDSVNPSTESVLSATDCNESNESTITSKSIGDEPQEGIQHPYMDSVEEPRRSPIEDDNDDERNRAHQGYNSYKNSNSYSGGAWQSSRGSRKGTRRGRFNENNSKASYDNRETYNTRSHNMPESGKSDDTTEGNGSLDTNLEKPVDFNKPKRHLEFRNSDLYRRKDNNRDRHDYVEGNEASNLSQSQPYKERNTRGRGRDNNSNNYSRNHRGSGARGRGFNNNREYSNYSKPWDRTNKRYHRGYDKTSDEYPALSTPAGPVACSDWDGSDQNPDKSMSAGRGTDADWDKDISQNPVTSNYSRNRRGSAARDRGFDNNREYSNYSRWGDQTNKRNDRGYDKTSDEYLALSTPAGPEASNDWGDGSDQNPVVSTSSTGRETNADWDKGIGQNRGQKPITSNYSRNRRGSGVRGRRVDNREHSNYSRGWDQNNKRNDRSHKTSDEYLALSTPAGPEASNDWGDESDQNPVKTTSTGRETNADWDQGISQNPLASKSTVLEDNEDWDNECDQNSIATIVENRQDSAWNANNQPAWKNRNTVQQAEARLIQRMQLNVDAKPFELVRESNITPTEDIPEEHIESPHPPEDTWTDQEFRNKGGRNSFPLSSDNENYQKRRSEEWRNREESFPISSDKRTDPKRRSEGWRNKEDNKSAAKTWHEPFNRRSESMDKEYKQFRDEQRSNKNTVEFVKVIEMEKDLFTMPKEYALGHCVAADMRMGSGIAVAFKREFKDLDVLLNQREKQGGLAVLGSEEGRFIYYLVTKRESTGKPTYDTIWSSLQKMRDHIAKNGVKKLAIPRLGCGLDRLEWSRVKHMIEFLFRDVDVEITVCNFQQTEDSPAKSQSCKVVHVQKSVADIEAYTIILYLSTEDGHVTSEMEKLAEKFPFLGEFMEGKKHLGEVIKYEVRNKAYILYGCIVRKTMKDDFDFISFRKCITQINKNNKKDAYEYVAIQAIADESDDLFMEKIITLLRNCLVKVDVYVCWDGDLARKMPVSHRDLKEL